MRKGMRSRAKEEGDIGTEAFQGEKVQTLIPLERWNVEPETLQWLKGKRVLSHQPLPALL